MRLIELGLVLFHNFERRWKHDNPMRWVELIQAITSFAGASFADGHEATI